MKTFIFCLLLGYAAAICLWGCDEQTSDPKAASDLNLEVEGDNNLVNVVQDMQQEHAAHLEQIKIGVFTILATIAIVLITIALYFAWKKYRSRYQARVEQRALELVERGQAQEPSNTK